MRVICIYTDIYIYTHYYNIYYTERRDVTEIKRKRGKSETASERQTEKWEIQAACSRKGGSDGYP